MKMQQTDPPLLVASTDQLGPAAEARPLIERLRTDVLWHQRRGNDTIARDCQEAADEIERLTAALKLANDQAERFERGWYLRGDALEKLQGWADAYPLAVFPEPDFAKAHELLQAGGMTLDAISASNMRHVISGVRKLVDEGLKA
jgi:hypothetical protein